MSAQIGRPRSLPINEPGRGVTAWISNKHHAALRRLALARPGHISTSQLIREAVAEYVERHAEECA